MSHVTVQSLYAILLNVDPLQLGTDMMKFIYSTDTIHVAQDLLNRYSKFILAFLDQN